MTTRKPKLDYRASLQFSISDAAWESLMPSHAAADRLGIAVAVRSHCQIVKRLLSHKKSSRADAGAPPGTERYTNPRDASLV